VLTRLRNARFFSTLDLRWGFNNVRIKNGDEWKGAFSTNRGLFEPLVMFFGLCNSPATFQTMMNDVLRRFIDKNVAILRQHKLFLKPEKCAFEKSSVNYLGLVISRGCVSMDPVKVRGVSDWPLPKKVKEVQSFLGFVNFYRRFIRDFAEIAQPLDALTHKKRSWSWGESENSAFVKLKAAVTSAPTLAFPSDNGPFRLECDASNFATGAVLSQRQRDGCFKRQGDARDYAGTRGLASLPRGLRRTVRNLHRSQKFSILPRGPKAQSPSGSVVCLPLQI